MKYIIWTLVVVSNWAMATEVATANLTTTTQNRAGSSLLADSIGKTLYVFDIDNGKPKSACEGMCAEIWPPYVLTADEAKALRPPLGSLKRSNNLAQLTYDGRLVYTYAFDRVAGDDHGDGLNGVWHSVKEGELK